MHTISVPLFVQVSNKKRFYLNLNQYRNAHFRTLDKAKKLFHEQTSPSVRHLPWMNRIQLIYTLFSGSKQLCDVANVCSVVDKFFSDVMVSCGRIEDDNYTVVTEAVYRYGGIDRNNPRVEVTIIPDQPTQKETQDMMEITINERTIKKAITLYLSAKMPDINPDSEIDIDLRATRGDDGYTAVIQIAEEGETLAEANTSDSAPTTQPVKKEATSPKKGNPEKTSEKQPEVEPEPTPEPEPDIPATGEAGEPEPETDTAEGDAAVEETAEETATEETAEPEPTEPKRPSLFGGLTRPDNR